MTVAQQRRWLADRLSSPFEAGQVRVGSVTLADFQRSAQLQIEGALARYGGALLADEVGMGKTHVAVAVAGGFQAVLVLAPASLTPMWRRVTAGSAIVVASHGQLTRGRLDDVEAGLLIVDEAHRFVRPQTRGYRALATLASRMKLLLVTATPVGLDPSDLAHLLRLFVPHGALIPRLGCTLEEHLSRVGAAGGTGASKLSDLVVRRSRALVRALHPRGVRVRGADGRRQILDFPRCHDRRVHYRSGLALPRVLRGLEALDEAVLGLPSGLLRTFLASRLESSPEALDRSLVQLESFVVRRLEAIASGADLSRQRWHSLFAGVDVAQVVFPFAFGSSESPGAPDVATVSTALATVGAIRQEVATLISDGRKLGELTALLRSHGRSRRVLIFSRYVDTARALFAHLSTTVDCGIALVHGGGAQVSGLGRATVDEAIGRFVEDQYSQSQSVGVLVATDVLAAGHNLQRAELIVSYDLPWNPRTLVQRQGRADRLGPRGRQIDSVLLCPDPETEAVLGVIERVAKRARAAMCTGAGSFPTLLDDLDVAYMQRITTGLAQPTSGSPLSDGDQLALFVLDLGSVGCDEAEGSRRGWCMSATPRCPGGALVALDLGVAGAPPWWCWIDAAGAGETQPELHLEGLRRLANQVAQPCPQLPPVVLRQAMSAALAARRRRRAALLRPFVHAPTTAAAKLLRALTAAELPTGQASAVLRRPLTPALSAAVERQLAAGTAPSEIVRELAAAPVPERSQVSDSLELLGFVRFV